MILRLISYQLSDDAPIRVGALVDDLPHDLLQAFEVAGMDLPERACLGSVASLLACPECLDLAREAVASVGEATVVRDAKILAPIPRPPKLFCLATNFMSHMAESISQRLQGGAQQRELDTPRVFMKPSTNTVIGPGEPLRLDAGAQFVDWEAEMAIIIGRPAKEVSVEDAPAHISGVTAFNDISERELKIWEREEERDWDRFFDWLNGKWCDGFAPMGPCAVPVADAGDPDELDLLLRLNGEVKQQANTREMIFNVAETVSYISHICTLETGDVIACGTPAGVGKHQDIRLKDGDVLEVEIPPVGVLRTPVVGA
ncbi:MAG: fumarylacetoacetate hydrolase family protein [Armatimonadota bacterium]|jgi:2-keto-4-pentenoate hydratase/2-oxohepta-3-ene-1,7-dioic acid hydratase in catechol pathway